MQADVASTVPPRKLCERVAEERLRYLEGSFKDTYHPTSTRKLPKR